MLDLYLCVSNSPLEDEGRPEMCICPWWFSETFPPNTMGRARQCSLQLILSLRTYEAAEIACTWLTAEGFFLFRVISNSWEYLASRTRTTAASKHWLHHVIILGTYCHIIHSLTKIVVLIQKIVMVIILPYRLWEEGKVYYIFWPYTHFVRVLLLLYSTPSFPLHLCPLCFAFSLDFKRFDLLRISLCNLLTVLFTYDQRALNFAHKCTVLFYTIYKHKTQT